MKEPVSKEHSMQRVIFPNRRRLGVITLLADTDRLEDTLVVGHTSSGRLRGCESDSYAIKLCFVFAGLSWHGLSSP
jgi:hypothetical protein